MIKKVAIVVNNSWYAWNMRAKLGFTLKNKNYDVVFICPYDEYSERIKENFDYFDIKINSKGMNPLEDLKTIYRYYKIYKEVKPDIILHYTIKPNIYGTIAASLLNIPIINNIAGLGTLFIKQNIVTRIAKLLYKVSQKKASKIFFQNKDDFEMFIHEKLVDRKKCDILPGSGVDLDRFEYSLKKVDKKFVFLLVSRMLWAKGIEEFVNAAKILKNKYNNVEFQLLGHLDMQSPTAISKSKMDKWVQEGYVNYLGSSDDVRIEIKKSDCIVLPSYYREGTPRILLESASMGKPIITTNNVGCRDVVDDGINGFLCKIKDSEDLAQKMETMLNLSSIEREEMGKIGRDKMIKEFDEKIVIDKYLNSIKVLT